MKKPSKAKVREAFRANYRASGDPSKAWHDTVTSFTKRGRPSDKQMVANILNGVHEDVLLEEGDVASIAAKQAADTIAETEVLTVLENEYEAVSQGLTQEELDQLQYPVLFVEFGDDGSVSDMSIGDLQSYAPNGPAVAVFPGRSIDEVRRDISAGLRELVQNPGIDFARRHSVTLQARRINGRPDGQDWPEGSSHWDCTLARGSRSMQMIFSTGPAIDTKPDVADVLYAAGADALVYETVQNPGVLVQELGLDASEAKHLYRAVERQTSELQMLMGTQDLYTELLCEVDANPNVNPVSPRMRAALFAGAGSILGTIVGAALAGGAGAWMGSIAGGAVGGYAGSSERTKVGGTVGGMLGGTVFPLGAAAGAYIGTYEGADGNPEALTVSARHPEEAARKANRLGRVLDVHHVAPGSYRVLVDRLTVRGS